MIAAARELFEGEGFRATTIAAVAARAGVSAESVYKGFGTKAVLAKAVFDQVIAGDDEPVAVWERPELVAMRAEPDVHRKIALFVAALVERVQRSAGVQILIRDGRHVDDGLRPVWEALCAEALTGMTVLAGHLLETGQLRRSISATEVRDLLFNYVAVDHYERLVLGQRWPIEQYTTWLTRAITTALCPFPLIEET
ncbi:TetR/AcrR family transcriptional regulator [Pseudonocardia sp. TRM90224]|uniref:TetR/AcrR family transcriptional regulator n=1 Tax=Pseudonocardia sp. TRM90224 TaxID=2812678 RepID=UPI001E50161D|nr:helix-turn-helix domain-containing protein [Pseudonocardia sp. TRM90224]